MADESGPEKPPAKRKAKPSPGVKKDDLRETGAVTPEYLTALVTILKALCPDKPDKESQAEIDSRLRIAEAKSDHELRQDVEANAHRRMIERRVCLLIVGSVLLTLVVSAMPAIPESTRNATLGIFLSTITGGLGFLAGKNSKG